LRDPQAPGQVVNEHRAHRELRGEPSGEFTEQIHRIRVSGTPAVIAGAGGHGGGDG
jgi:hypothetical protein